MKYREAVLNLIFAILFLAAPLAAEAQQEKFWAMELGNQWDYVEGISDTWPARNQVTIDTSTFPFPTYLVETREFQGSTLVEMEKWWYDILETGPNSSELRVWRIMFSDVDWVSLKFDSGIVWAKRPMTVGDFWTSNATGIYSEGQQTDSITITVNSEVLSYGPVEVPFGNQSYNAYKIRHIINISGMGQITQTLSVVPYLGIIKTEIVDAEGYEADYLSSVDIATVFNDALYDHWAYPYIMQIYDSRITAGCYLDNPNTPENEASYCPEDDVTREAMAVFIIRAMDEIPPDGYCGTTNPFPDVSYDRWSCKFIKRLEELDISSGYEDGRFGPGDSVTREQMAIFITRALAVVPVDGYCGTMDPFTDVSSDRWSCKYIKKFAEMGITSGYGDGRFGPGDYVTRDQMAVFLSRAFLGM